MHVSAGETVIAVAPEKTVAHCAFVKKSLMCIGIRCGVPGNLANLDFATP